MNKDASSMICVGVISAAHGIKGAVKIKSFTEIADSIFDYTELTFDTGESVKLVPNGVSGGALLATMEGVTDRNAAELLKGKKLYIARDSLPETGEGEFYIEDLIGLTVKIAYGREVGKIHHVANYGAGDVLEVRFNNGTEEMYLFSNETFPIVDIAAGFVQLNAPEVLEAKKPKR